MVNKRFMLKAFLAGLGTAFILNAIPKYVSEVELNLKEKRVAEERISEETERQLELQKEKEIRIIYERIKGDIVGKSPRDFPDYFIDYPLITMEAMKENRKERVMANKSREGGLEFAIDRARGDVPYAKHQFLEEGVPEKYAFLGIVESNWLNLTSKAEAVGVFQQIESTAKNYGAIVESHYDERLHPIIAAGKSAHLLRYLYDNFGDWNLALAAYNSKGFPWGYLSETNKTGETPSLEGYLKYAGKSIKRNSSNKTNLGYLDENLQFLARNFANFEILEESYPDFFYASPQGKESLNVYPVEETPLKYKVQRGDSLWKVAKQFASKKYGIESNQATNGTLNWMQSVSKIDPNIHPGQEIILYPPRTLSEIESQIGIPLSRRNPHIIDKDSFLPTNAKVFLEN